MISIISQCINPMVVRKGAKVKREGKDDPPRIDNIEAYANHVTRFSLAGIRAIRAGARKNPAGVR